MPTLTYRGDYGSSMNLTNPRTASLAIDGTIPSNPIRVTSAKARIYVSTTNRSRTYKYHVEIDDGYYGDLNYNFASVDNPVYVDVPIVVESLDYDFPCKTISTITVTETGGHGDSTRIRGLVRVLVNYVNVNEPVPPTNLRLNGETAINLEAGTTATLTWTAASVDTYDEMGLYRVRYYDVENATWTTVGTTTGLTYEITAPYTDSKSYYFYVEVLTLYYSRTSTTYASIYTFIQLTAPTIYGAGSSTVYNPRPMLLVELGEGPIDEYMTLVANGWTPSRRGLPHDHIFLKRNAAYSTATEESITLTETDERMRSIDTTVSVSYEAPEYTNAEIIAGGTIVKAADITELQDALNHIRAGYGMEEYTFTACVAGVTSLTLWTTHITELQNCAREIQAYINAWDTQSPTWAVILPSMVTTLGPSAEVMNQLRRIVTLL